MKGEIRKVSAYHSEPEVLGAIGMSAVIGINDKQKRKRGTNAKLIERLLKIGGLILPEETLLAVAEGVDRNGAKILLVTTTMPFEIERTELPPLETLV